MQHGPFGKNGRGITCTSSVYPWCVLISVSVAVIGCGGGDPPGAPVKGQITLDGDLLPAGTVIFEPDAQKGNTSKREFRAQIDPANPGVYELKPDGDGVSLGWYRVAVFAIQSPNRMTRPVWLADQKYSNANSSGLSVQVVVNPSDGAYDFDLKRGGGSQ